MSLHPDRLITIMKGNHDIVQMMFSNGCQSNSHFSENGSRIKGWADNTGQCSGSFRGPLSLSTCPPSTTSTHINIPIHVGQLLWCLPSHMDFLFLLEMSDFHLFVLPRWVSSSLSPGWRILVCSSNRQFDRWLQTARKAQDFPILWNPEAKLHRSTVCMKYYWFCRPH